MLILTRKSGQSIRVGDSVIRFVKVGRGAVQVAIEAPKSTPVLRGELVKEAA